MKYTNKLVENVLQGNFGPTVVLESQYEGGWKMDWAGQGNPPTKGALINFDAEKKGRYWKMTAFEFSDGQQQQQQPQQAGNVVQQFVPQNGGQQNYQPSPQQNYQQQNGSQQNYQPAPQQNGMDEKEISIVLQVCMKASANPAQADAWLKWYHERKADPYSVQQQGVDPKSFPNHTMPLDTAVGDDIPF